MSDCIREKNKGSKSDNPKTVKRQNISSIRRDVCRGIISVGVNKLKGDLRLSLDRTVYEWYYKYDVAQGTSYRACVMKNDPVLM